MKELKGQREQTIKCRDGIEEICEWNGLTVVPKEVPVTVNRANASMMVFSMMEIAKAKGLDPQKYLQYLIDKRPSSNMTDEELEQLVPWSVAVKSECSKNVE